MISVSCAFNRPLTLPQLVEDFAENKAPQIKREMMRPGHSALTREICWGRGDWRALNLIGAGANDHEQAGGVPPIVYAACHDRYHTILALAGKGVDPNQEYAGSSPLHYAVFMGKLEAVKALLTAGANPNQENDLGLTPLQMAQWCAKDANASNLEGGELSMQQRSPIAAQLLQAASDRATAQLLQAAKDRAAVGATRQEYLIPAYQ